MSRVTIKTGFLWPDGKEEELSEFLCDVSGCPNIATQVLGCILELRIAGAVCEEHAASLNESKASIEHPKTAVEL